MKILYFVLAVLVVLGFVFFVGMQYGIQKCQNNNTVDNAQQQNNIIHIKEKINEEVITTGTDDIRQRLYQKYTIAD